MDPYRTPPVLEPEPRARFNAMPWLRAGGRAVKRYAAGIIPLAAVFAAFSVGRFFWCQVLSFSDDLAGHYLAYGTKGYVSDPTGWCVWVWVLGMVIIASPIWAPRLGNKVIDALWPAKVST